MFLTLHSDYVRLLLAAIRIFVCTMIVYLLVRGSEIGLAFEHADTRTNTHADSNIDRAAVASGISSLTQTSRDERTAMCNFSPALCTCGVTATTNYTLNERRNLRKYAAHHTHQL